MDQPAAKTIAPAAWLLAPEASDLLGVKRATLYAYASRGLVRTTASVAGDRARRYLRDDLERLRARSLARSGHAPVAAAALRFGEPVLETRIGEIRADGPHYRGVAALALAEGGASFEDVCARLWDGASPPPAEGEPRSLRDPEGDVRTVERALRRAGAGGGGASPGEPFEAILRVAAALAAGAPRTEPSLAVARAGAPRLVRALAAAPALGSEGGRVAASLGADGVARGLLLALGGRTVPRAVDAVRQALVLTAEHELNASTFAARIAASTGARLEACVLAALATLSGPLHGAATARVEALLVDVRAPERAAQAVKSRLERAEEVPGFGHPLYPDGDPRGARLLEVAGRIAGRSRALATLAAVVDTMDLVARARPTVDVGLVAVRIALGLPAGSALAIFATARSAGWIAHALEQRAAGHLLRPRARYVGP